MDKYMNLLLHSPKPSTVLRNSPLTRVRKNSLAAKPENSPSDQQILNFRSSFSPKLSKAVLSSSKRGRHSPCTKNVRTLTSLSPPSLPGFAPVPHSTLARRSSDTVNAPTKPQKKWIRKKKLVKLGSTRSPYSCLKKEKKNTVENRSTKRPQRIERSESMKDFVTQLASGRPGQCCPQQLTPQEIESKNETHYKDHLTQTFQHISLVRSLPLADLTEVTSRMRELPRKSGYEGKKTVIFDLDETLVHCCEDLTAKADVVLPVKLPSGEVIRVAMRVRPYALECLRRLNKYFEVIIFTASHQSYADAVLDYLDPTGQLIHHRLYRQDCIVVNGVYIKDLRIFTNRTLDDIVIVDNAVYSFCYQLDNGIPIISWMDNMYDRELFNLVDYLKVLAKIEDIRVVNRKTFRLATFYEDFIQQFTSGN